MRNAIAFLKRLSLGKLLAVCLVGVLMLMTTACNRGDLRGARPVNPPVQLGGENNPHKMGGDSYTKYKMSDDPQMNDVANPDSYGHSKPGAAIR